MGGRVWGVGGRKERERRDDLGDEGRVEERVKQ